MVSNPVTGAAYVLRGLGLLNKPNVRRFVVIPLAINVLLFLGVLLYAGAWFDTFIEWALGELPAWLDWLDWVLWPLFAIMYLLVVFFTFTVIANIIGAPFNGYLADAVERHLTGRPPPGSERGMLAEAGVAITGEFRKLGYYALWAIPLAILSFIPLTAPAAPFLWMVFSAWMMAMEYADYPMGNHGMSFPEVRRKLAGRRVLSLGFGGGVAVATLVPVLNFLVMPTAVAGATALWVEQFSADQGVQPPG